ncbi:helix-turn-helix domain-containing protein [Clostridium fermenticellae]|uniref:Helix-turn-helix domain-containing protein n=1 Tax=Clostridium fermenticellae TaxID=2068654 RepID=A0A386H2A0_9CLOT|nr:helix-turn-helix domain-containing protein [Clostridium fermenticellae]AYD39827.1 helix-turn-helix domain-containing protein [Clostridium fermenticellae]
MTNYTVIDNPTITSSISDNSFRIYNFLLSLCYGNKDCCYPSQQYIAGKLHKSVRTVQRGLNELVKAKFIKVRRRGSISNIYTMLKKEVSTKVEGVVNKVKKTIEKVKNYPVKKPSLFNNYPQRQYNFNELENQLLGNNNYDSSKLIE